MSKHIGAYNFILKNVFPLLLGIFLKGALKKEYNFRLGSQSQERPVLGGDF